MELKDKVTVVSGASSGLGRSIAKAVAAEGATVALLARTEEKLEQVKREIEQAGGAALAVPMDITSPDAVERAVTAVVKHWGGIDVLVNNAGLGIFKHVHDMTLEEWDTHINVMLRGAFLLTKSCLPHLYQRERGHIVMISSLWAKRFCAKCAGYTAAKYGLRGFADSLREEAREHNVKVTNVMPSTVDTPFFEQAEWETDLTRALQPEDVGATVVHALKMPDRAVIEEVVLQAIRPQSSECR